MVSQLSCQLKEAERNYFRKANIDLNSMHRENFSLDHAMKYAIESMDKVSLYLEDNIVTAVQQDPAYETLELKVRTEHFRIGILWSECKVEVKSIKFLSPDSRNVSAFSARCICTEASYVQRRAA